MPVTAGRSVVESILNLVVELQSRDSTAMDAAARLGKKEETVRGHIAVMAARGLIEPAGTQWRKHGCRPIIWRWKR